MLREADDLGIEIRADQEATDFLDWVARRDGMAPQDVKAVTLGDLVMVRPEYARNPRILREEVVHVLQARGGTASTANRWANEIAARRKMIERASEWGITSREVREMRREIEILTRRLEK